jgi:hypothetical protein
MDELCRREARRAMMDLLSQERDRRYRSHHRRRVLGASPRSRKSLRARAERESQDRQNKYSHHLGVHAERSLMRLSGLNHAQSKGIYNCKFTDASRASTGPRSIINPGGRRTSPLGRAALHNALRRLGAPTEHGHGVTPEKIRAAFLAGRFLSCVPP